MLYVVVGNRLCMSYSALFVTVTHKQRSQSSFELNFWNKLTVVKSRMNKYFETFIFHFTVVSYILVFCTLNTVGTITAFLKFLYPKMMQNDTKQNLCKYKYSIHILTFTYF